MGRIKQFFKFNWMSKNFFIRLFLTPILIAEWLYLLQSIKNRNIDLNFLITMMAFVGTLIASLTIQNIKKK